MNETCSFVSRLTWKEFLFFIWTTTATAIWQLWPCAVTDENKNVISLFLFRFAADGEYSRTDRELFDLNLEKILFTAKFNVTLLREKHLRSFLSVMLFFLFVCVSCTHYLFIMLLGIICCCYIFMLIFIIIYFFLSGSKAVIFHFSQLLVSPLDDRNGQCVKHFILHVELNVWFE